MAQRYGLGVDNNLSDVENNVTALRYLGFLPEDLYILPNTGASGVSATDYINCSGLKYHLEPQTSQLLTRATNLVNNQSLYVANSGDVNIGSLYAPTVNADRGYTDLGNYIYATSSGSFFSTTNPSGDYSQGGQYKVGSLRADTTTVSGLGYTAPTTDWNDTYVKYRNYIPLKNQAGTAADYVPTYLAPPTVLQSNVLWFDSEYSTFTLDGSNNVSEWQDVYGRGTLVQTASAARPAYTTNVLNGKPGVVFNGSQSLVSPTIHPLVPQAATVITVFRVADSLYNVIGTLNSSSNRWRDSNGNGDFGLFTDAIQSNFPTNMPIVGTFFSTVRISQNFGLDFRLNGVQKTFKSGGGFTYDSTGAFIVGRSASTANSFTGDIYAICVFDRVLNDVELATMEEYFAWRYDFVYDPGRAQPLELELGGTIDDESGTALTLG